jgi:hypothetical protein
MLTFCPEVEHRRHQQMGETWTTGVHASMQAGGIDVMLAAKGFWRAKLRV